MQKQNKYYSKPYMNINNLNKLAKGKYPDEYQKGKAMAFLFVLDKLNHGFEGSAVSILNQMDKYLNAELKKLGANITIDVDEFDITKNDLDGIEVRLNMKRGDPFKEGTD